MKLKRINEIIAMYEKIKDQVFISMEDLHPAVSTQEILELAKIARARKREQCTNQSLHKLGQKIEQKLGQKLGQQVVQKMEQLPSCYDLLNALENKLDQIPFYTDDNKG